MTKLVIFTLLSVAATAWGFSGGAPELVCDDMVPKHPVAPQKSRLPYKIAIDKAEIKAGEQAQITIGSKSFKGKKNTN